MRLVFRQRQAVNGVGHCKLNYCLSGGGTIASRAATSFGRSSVTTCPHDVLIHSEVVVDDLVTHTDDVRPSDVGMTVAALSRNLPCGLADGLNSDESERDEGSRPHRTSRVTCRWFC